MRIIAGPNGSGKSTLVNQLKKRSEAEHTSFSLGYLLNADDLQVKMIESKLVNFLDFGFVPNKKIWNAFIEKNGERLITKKGKPYEFRLKHATLFISGRKPDSYLAAVIVQFICEQLLERKMNFSFETVFSHPGKIDFIRQARRRGYRVYVYFVSTASHLINIDRVKHRVAKGGHDVALTKIKERYFRSMELVDEYLILTNRTYLFDNTTSLSLCMQVSDGKDIVFHKPFIPAWMNHYVLNQ